MWKYSHNFMKISAIDENGNEKEERENNLLDENMKIFQFGNTQKRKDEGNDGQQSTKTLANEIVANNSESNEVNNFVQSFVKSTNFRLQLILILIFLSVLLICPKLIKLWIWGCRQN
jgi:hypothetical protein